jgi:transcriptional regulator with XRE-family HTH domain
MAPRYTIAAKRVPNPTDKHVGSRLRMRRKMLAMSQTKLGDALGVTFQQVQKYEKGTNRIPSSRLQQISHILQVPVAFFFEGVSTPQMPTTQIDAFVSDSSGLRLIGAFMRIDNVALRRRIAKLVQDIADDAERRTPQHARRRPVY